MILKSLRMKSLNRSVPASGAMVNPNLRTVLADFKSRGVTLPGRNDGNEMEVRRDCNRFTNDATRLSNFG